METKIIAIAQTGKIIECAVEINETGEISTQYPIEYVENKKMNLKGYAITLSKKQAEEIFNRSCPVKKVNIMLKNQSDWQRLKSEAEKIRESYLIKKMTAEWETMLTENTKLKLWWAVNSGGDTIINLPKIFKKKQKKLVKIIKWENEDGKDVAGITANELNELIKKINAKDKKIKQEIGEKIERLQKQAVRTGIPQKYFEYSTECDNPRIGCDIDNIIVYIDSAGNQIEERHHCY